MRLRLALILLTCVYTAGFYSATAAETTADLELLSQRLLANRCGDCHHNDSEGGIDYITNLRELVKRKKIVPGKPELSRIWLRINDIHDPMPPQGAGEPLSQSEKVTLRDCIVALAGPISGESPSETSALQLPKSVAKRVSIDSVIADIHNYLARLDAPDKSFQRFIVLNHLHNAALEGESLSDEASERLRIVRAAVSKSINSLTWCSTITVPTAIDNQQTILAIDLRDFQWDRNSQQGRPTLWNLLVEGYPYALKHNHSDSAVAVTQFDEISQWTSAEVPWVRADWFVANTTQPQYYHSLLFDAVMKNVRTRSPKRTQYADGKTRSDQPMSQDDLLSYLNVDLAGNLRRSRAQRAAFTRSGVSSQPRMIERHAAAFGYLWNSYDFKRGSQFMNLNARPLGPASVYQSPSLEDVVFRHDGGEMIFGLPNGLHGYFLVDGDGQRIPFGPPDVVEDRAKTLGNGVIVNGLSCIACHKNGLIEDFRDEVRFGIDAMEPAAKRMVRKLFVDRADLDPLIQTDQRRYREAAIECLEPFLSTESVAAMNAGGQLVEPIGPVAKQFLVDTLTLEDLAFELGVSTDRLRGAIEFDPQLQQLGLAAVVGGAKINREVWESGAGTSMFQKVAKSLKLGTPTGVVAQHWRGQ